jgi:hypothetical protein
MRLLRSVAAIVLASSIAACGSPGPMTLDGVTILRHGFMNGYPAALFAGTVHFREGCVWADAEGSGESQVIIWPPMSRLEHRDSRLVLLVDGIVLEDGDSFSIGGGQEPPEFARELAGPIPEACVTELYWLGGPDINP